MKVTAYLVVTHSLNSPESWRRVHVTRQNSMKTGRRTKLNEFITLSALHGVAINISVCGAGAQHPRRNAATYKKKDPLRLNATKNP